MNILKSMINACFHAFNYEIVSTYDLKYNNDILRNKEEYIAQLQKSNDDWQSLNEMMNEDNKKILTLNQELHEANGRLLKLLDDAYVLTQNMQNSCQNTITYITKEICKRYNVDEIEMNELINQACSSTSNERVDSL